MKFFIDTANLDEITALTETGMVDGVTTNPSLIAKSGRPFLDAIAEICHVVTGPVSAEVTATDAPTMIKEGRKLAAIADNVAVKVPLTEDGLMACKALSDADIMVNVTLCFSAAQAILAAKARATFVSPFVGRLDDLVGRRLVRRRLGLGGLAVGRRRLRERGREQFVPAGVALLGRVRVVDARHLCRAWVGECSERTSCKRACAAVSGSGPWIDSTLGVPNSAHDLRAHRLALHGARQPGAVRRIHEGHRAR